MRLMAICMAVIVAIGYLLGGRLRNVSELQIDWAWLALVGLALQFVTGPGSTFPLMCLYLSFALLIVFTIKNIRVFGFPVILAGVLCNLLVIGINGGMPVSKHALRASDQGQFLGDLENNPYPKHHLATDDDLLRFLGDAIPLPSPIEQAISVGDILTYAGVGIVIVGAMRKPRHSDRVANAEVAHAGG
jgi:VanZ family protein